MKNYRYPASNVDIREITDYKNFLKSLRRASYLFLLLALVGAAPAVSQGSIEIDFGGDISGNPGDEVTVEVSVSDLTGLEVGNFDFTIQIDEDLLDISRDDVVEGPMLDRSLTKNITSDNRLIVAYAAGTNFLEGEGVLFRFAGTLGNPGENEAGLSVTRFTIGEPGLHDVSPDAPFNIKVTSSGPAIELPEINGTINHNFKAPIRTISLAELDITSYELEFHFDPNVISFDDVSLEGTVSEGGSVNFSVPDDGHVVISANFSEPLGAGTELLNLTGTLENIAENSPLTFSEVNLYDSNDAIVFSFTRDGSVTVNPIPEAADFTLVSPEDNFVLDVEGPGGTEFAIEWETADSDEQVIYNFHLDIPGGDFSDPLITDIADDDGMATTYTTNFESIRNFLESQGVAIGDTATYRWTVTAHINDYVKFAVDTFTLNLFEPISGISHANLQSPEIGQIIAGEEFIVHARVEAEGFTDNGESEDIQAWVGVNTDNVAPWDDGWNWIPSEFNDEYDNAGHEYMVDIGSDLEPGTYYYVSRFQLMELDYVYGGFDGGFWDGENNVSGELTVVESIDAEDIAEMPKEFSIEQNYPNPFNPTTQISYSVPEQAHVRLDVYSALGQQIATIVNENKSPGRYEVTFDATNLSSGVYLYRLQTESHTESRQMLLVK